MSLSSFECRHETVNFESSVTGKARILHLSDLHLWGFPWETRRMERWHEKIIELAPDAVMITGDLADTRYGVQSFFHWLRHVSQICPIYWIRGNHDCIPENGETLEFLKIGRIYDIDQNDSVLPITNGLELTITTWERWVEAPVSNAIVLIHNPRSIVESKVVKPVLILAGHLHGGQWVLWKDAKGAGWPPALFYPWCGDRWALQQGHLIVSRGLGDTIPIRIRCPREMVVIDICVELCK